MIDRLINLAVLLAFFVCGMMVDYMLRAVFIHDKELSNTVSLTGVNQVATQKAFYQRGQNNIAYDELVGIKKMDFVYEK